MPRGSRLTSASPGRWLLWAAPGWVTAAVLAVDAAAVAVVAATARLVPVTAADLVQGAVLAAGSVLHCGAVRGIERLRTGSADDSSAVNSCVNLRSMWVFAGLLVVPPPLVAALVMVSCMRGWLRAAGGLSPWHREVTAAAAMVLAGAGAGVVLVAGGVRDYPLLPGGPGGLVVLVAAAAAWWLVNYLVGDVLLAGRPDRSVRPGRSVRSVRLVQPQLSGQLVVLAAIGLGVAIAVLMEFNPWLVGVLAATVLAVHRGLLVDQFEQAARTDHKTRLLNVSSWREATGRRLARARRTGQPLGVLMIDLDHFKTINDRSGHLAGDTVLRAVADELLSSVRRDDLVGRFGGDEFVVALPGVTAAALDQLAGRMCDRVRRLAVEVPTKAGIRAITGLTISVGGALYPDTAADLDGLLLAADGALLRAKDTGRDQVLTC